jgi:hypothetical protein
MNVIYAFRFQRKISFDSLRTDPTMTFAVDKRLAYSTFA